MQHSAWLRNVVRVGACVGAITLLVAVALPQTHPQSADSETDQLSQSCQSADFFSATPPLILTLDVSTARILPTVIHAHEAPRMFLVIRVLSPRAPPAFA